MYGTGTYIFTLLIIAGKKPDSILQILSRDKKKTSPNSQKKQGFFSCTYLSNQFNNYAASAICREKTFFYSVRFLQNV